MEQGQLYLYLYATMAVYFYTLYINLHSFIIYRHETKISARFVASNFLVS
jgi:hypothetical protein